MPSLPNYQDFELAIEKDGAQYRAHVLNSPGGEGSNTFVLPFTELEIKNMMARMGDGGKVTDDSSSDWEATKKFGSKLFQAAFAGDVLRCWQISLARVQVQNQFLRLRLRLNDVPALVHLPWELIYDASLKSFYTRSIETPLVRELEVPAASHPLFVQPPLKILVLISLPNDVQKLNADQEWNNLKTALRDLEERNILTLERMDDATLPALQQKLRRDQYHILHFVGHGDFDVGKQEGVLYLEQRNKLALPVGAELLGTILQNHPSMRFVFLNACDGAQSSIADAFSGVAQTLIRTGIPAVLAMQYRISDDAALTFSNTIYGALADNYPLDAALSEARVAIYSSDNETEWATPVLYLRAADGILFDVQPAAGIAPPSPQAAPRLTPSTAPLNANTTVDFNPIGKWDIQVQDMVGSRLYIEFLANGTFQMQQQVGMYQVPVNGSWTFNAVTRQLALQGVVNTFQPFVLDLTLGNRLPNGFTATGGDGIGYIITRSA